MAQVDTGLGWSAEQSYLLSTGNTVLGVFSTLIDPNGVFTGQPLPKNLKTAAEVASGGLIYAEDNTYYWKIACDSNDQIFVFMYSYYMCPVSLVHNATVHSVRVQKSNGSTSRFGTQGLGSSDSGFYYTNITTGTGSWQLPSNATMHVPVFASRSDGFSNLSTLNQTFYKLNPGYTVACIATINFGGTIQDYPVLISSVSDYAHISKDNIHIDTDEGTSEYIRDGIPFVMRIDVPAWGSVVTSTNLTRIDLTNIGANTTLRQVFGSIATAANIIVLSPGEDPYDPNGDNSNEPGGGLGEDPQDDNTGIVHNQIPGGYGFVRVYTPSESDLDSLYNYMWGTLDLDNVKRLFSAPMDSIIGLSIVPIALTGTNVNFTIGGVSPPFTLPEVDNQYYWISCGAVNIGKQYGSYLDYEPYTQFSIYLPFIGMRQISADDIMGKQVILEYDIDILSGSCIARLQAGTHLLYTWAGQCAMQIPVNGSNWDSIFRTAISAATGIAGIATGGAGAVLGGIASAAVNALTIKPNIQRSGAFAGSSGWMNNLTPYIIRSTPEAAIPGNQNKFIGYPSFTEVTLSTITGYNEIASIHLEGISGTDAEISELESILKSGVIF